MTIVLVVIGLSLQAIKPGPAKTAPKALAMAVADELRGARQLAIRSGHPVAIGLPANGGSRVASSLYRLEGWNVPHVSWSIGYSGDYPNLGFAAASWSPSTGTFALGGTPPPISKFAGFDLNNWIPTQYAADSIFCFTPDGGIITNNLPAMDDRYTIVVAGALTTSGTAATGGDEPAVVYIDNAGGVEVNAGTRGTTLPAGGALNTSAPRLRDDMTSQAQVYLGDIVVRPDPGAATSDGFCVPGQHVTLELFAFDTEGRQLFAKWDQTNSSGGDLGTFSFPDSQSTTAALQGELERMEFIDEIPSYVNFPGTTTPIGGCFRGRWTWTVPITSQPGDQYTLTAAVRDSRGLVNILNPAPTAFVTEVAPQGRLIVERFNAVTGLTELVRMNPDGTGETVLTAPNMEEKIPTLDRAGTKLAFLQRENGGQWAVKVRPLNGGQETTIAAAGTAVGEYTSVSISPDGAWVSYRDNHGPTGVGANLVEGELITKRVDNTGEFRRDQEWQFGFGPAAQALKQSRTGWSWDSNGVRWMIWENGSKIMLTDLTADPLADPDFELISEVRSSGAGIYEEQLYAPTFFTTPAGQGRVMFTIGNVDSVLAHCALDIAAPVAIGNTQLGNANIPTPDINGSGGGAGSAGERDNYPSVSTDGNFLILPRQTQATAARKAIKIPWTGTNFVGSANNEEITQDILSVIWIP